MRLKKIQKAYSNFRLGFVLLIQKGIGKRYTFKVDLLKVFPGEQADLVTWNVIPPVTEYKDSKKRHNKHKLLSLQICIQLFQYYPNSTLKSSYHQKLDINQT